MNNDSNETSVNDNESIATTVTDTNKKNNYSKPSLPRLTARKRKRGMAKMIVIGTRVSGKYGHLMENPKGPSFRRMRDWVLGIVVKSVGPNKYEVKFDNGVTKEVSSNALRIEEADSGIPVEEAAPSLEPTGEESAGNEDSNYTPDSEESEDVLFPMDTAGVNPFPDSDDEADASNNESNNDNNLHKKC